MCMFGKYFWLRNQIKLEYFDNSWNIRLKRKKKKEKVWKPREIDRNEKYKNEPFSMGYDLCLLQT